MDPDWTRSPGIGQPDEARILVAEDHSINQRLIAALLKKLGCLSEVVSDGSEALQCLRSGTYDLLLLDCQMPVLDGYQTAAQIRRPDSGVLSPTIPIVALTANAMRGDREKCLAAGMDDYLSKPVCVEALVTVLNRWLPEAVRVLPAKSREREPQP
jgi:CheY-like chemotaxis protein